MAHHHTILCIDDDPDDVALLRDALKSIDPHCVLLTAGNGALGLQQLGVLQEAGTLPCLIVLDINMPVMDGRQTFLALRKEQAFDAVPVVIFTTSNNVMDKAFFAGKNCEYLTKPLNYDSLVEMARRFLTLCRNR